MGVTFRTMEREARKFVEGMAEEGSDYYGSAFDGELAGKDLELIKRLGLEEEAKTLYNSIRRDKTDIEKICANTGTDKNVVRKAKEHVFINKYEFDKGSRKRRFNPYYGSAAVWERLASGEKIKESDKIWIMHEYHESLLMGKGMPYQEAHGEVNKIYNWVKATQEDKK